MTDLSPRRIFADQLTSALLDMANDYQRIADNLRRVAGRVECIGTPEGLGQVEAIGLATEALREIARSTPSPAMMVTRAAEFERHVPSS